MDTVCTVCPILDIVKLKQNLRFSFMEWASFLTLWLQLFETDLKNYYVI